ncbi:MAG: ABC transporter permease [Amphibacillus sp.]|uniref:ABC transporter permease protein n=1 Tax=Amphibacillus xylanus (strain ATCC 51415 / DSM 6626 / JCM 7361 / LMG 17667 / NBRC 15112 / Ep01) TaxID=698758 RepID=K0IWS9_AMPXN|nr:methionine ABC transporter permease [Amphibacillus xylanus]NMA90829.1 ABC transporter permease [Amphibacillus sp.]BAM46940.1 ABC transporter permease protein [Amphibacillus xylanus NBRC 15112]
MTNLFPNVEWLDLIEATGETLYMTLVSMLGTLVLGLILGLVLYLTSPDGLWENKYINLIVATVVNVFRAIPFAILIFLLFPFTMLLFGTFRGTNAALPALIIGAAPFYARLVEIALREVDKGVIEAAESMGAKVSTIIWKVLIKESMPALVSGITVTTIAIVGYTAVAGMIGAGGLGDYAYYFGFTRRDFDIVFVCTVLIIVIVFVFQFIGDFITKKIDKR